MPAWLQSLLTAGILGAVVVMVGWLVQNRLSTKLERLKQDLAGSLAARARRADFLRDQITHLYGSLAFLVEANANLIATNTNIRKAYDEYFKTRYGEGYSTEMDGVIATANRYGELVVENNSEALKILRTQWGWLDTDDIEGASRYVTDIARHNVEFAEGKKLPVEFYETLESAVGTPVVFRSDFADQVRRKLREKRDELSGLTGTALAA